MNAELGIGFKVWKKIQTDFFSKEENPTITDTITDPSPGLHDPAACLPGLRLFSVFDQVLQTSPQSDIRVHELPSTVEQGVGGTSDAWMSLNLKKHKSSTFILYHFIYIIKKVMH